jgi:hypothetical protein
VAARITAPTADDGAAKHLGHQFDAEVDHDDGDKLDDDKLDVNDFFHVHDDHDDGCDHDDHDACADDLDPAAAKLDDATDDAYDDHGLGASLFLLTRRGMAVLTGPGTVRTPEIPRTAGAATPPWSRNEKLPPKKGGNFPVPDQSPSVRSQ